MCLLKGRWPPSSLAQKMLCPWSKKNYNNNLKSLDDRTVSYFVWVNLKVPLKQLLIPKNESVCSWSPTCPWTPMDANGRQWTPMDAEQVRLLGRPEHSCKQLLAHSASQRALLVLLKTIRSEHMTIFFYVWVHTVFAVEAADASGCSGSWITSPHSLLLNYNFWQCFF